MTVADLERDLLSVKPIAESLEQTYARVGPNLYRFAVALVGNADASDVVAEAVARSMRTTWSAVDNPDSYLFRAVLNESRSLLRKRRLRLRQDEPVAEMAAAPGRSDASAVEDRLLVDAALRRLSPQQRAAIVLTYWVDLPIADVAQALEVSEGAVKKHLARGRAKMRKELSS